jgi:large subunit ribosomal protein L31
LVLGNQEDIVLKKDIHPAYKMVTVKCACGNTFETRSTAKEIHIDICSNCHPFFTGKQKLIDTAGRGEKYMKKYSLDKNKAKKEEKAE